MTNQDTLTGIESWEDPERHAEIHRIVFTKEALLSMTDEQRMRRIGYLSAISGLIGELRDAGIVTRLNPDNDTVDGEAIPYEIEPHRERPPGDGRATVLLGPGD